jgi:hypothetical protein
MEHPDLWANIEINIPHSTEDGFEDSLSELFNSVADLLYDWAGDWAIDPVMSANFRDSIPEWLADSDGPLQDALACEADSESTES